MSGWRPGMSGWSGPLEEPSRRAAADVRCHLQQVCLVNEWLHAAPPLKMRLKCCNLRALSLYTFAHNPDRTWTTPSAPARGTLPGGGRAAAAVVAQASCRASPARLGARSSQAEARQGCRAVPEAGLLGRVAHLLARAAAALRAMAAGAGGLAGGVQGAESNRGGEGGSEQKKLRRSSCHPALLLLETLVAGLQSCLSPCCPGRAPACCLLQPGPAGVCYKLPTSSCSSGAASHLTRHPARSWRPVAARSGAMLPAAAPRLAARHCGGVDEDIPPAVHQTATSAPGQPEVLFRPDLGPHAQVMGMGC